MDDRGRRNVSGNRRDPVPLQRPLWRHIHGRSRAIPAPRVWQLLVQELKRTCYEMGRIPAARCNAANKASQRGHQADRTAQPGIEKRQGCQMAEEPGFREHVDDLSDKFLTHVLVLYAEERTRTSRSLTDTRSAGSNHTSAATRFPPARVAGRGARTAGVAWGAASAPRP
jgi:hypothetical protein